MKNIIRILLLICLSAIVSISIGCSSDEIKPLLYKDKKEDKAISSDAKELNYSIDKITLSNSYQSINPNIEIIKDGLDTNLLLSLGLIETSGVSVEKIEKVDRNVNIHIQNDTKNINSKLVIPQIVLHFDDLSHRDIENLNFQIINENYHPIKTNIDIGEAISKIESKLKISTSTFPDVTLKKQNEKTLLNLNFSNTVDLSDKENPIINLNVLIDLNNGKIISSKKNPVSSLIDEGDIIEYLTDRYIVYLKELEHENTTKYDLWIYDVEKDDKKVLYSSKNKISSFKFNDAGDKAVITESINGDHELYILNLKDLKLDGLKLEKPINPCMTVWKDEEIYLVEKENNIAKIYSYSMKYDSLNLISQIEKDIKKLDYLDGQFLFSIENDDKSEIYITENFKENILIDLGRNPLFINNNNIGYLKEDLDSGKVLLWTYNIEEESIKTYTDIDLEDFFIWEESLGFIERNQIGSDNPLYIYDFKTKEREFITSVKSNKIFLNTKENILYINTSVDIKDEKIPVISYIELDN